MEGPPGPPSGLSRRRTFRDAVRRVMCDTATAAAAAAGCERRRHGRDMGDDMGDDMKAT